MIFKHWAKLWQITSILLYNGIRINMTYFVNSTKQFCPITSITITNSKTISFHNLCSIFKSFDAFFQRMIKETSNEADSCVFLSTLNYHLIGQGHAWKWIADSLSFSLISVAYTITMKLRITSNTLHLRLECRLI